MQILGRAKTGRTRISPRLLALGGLVAYLLVLTPAPSQAADLIQVTVTVDRFIEIQSPDGGLFGQTHGNYYGRVNIDDQGFLDSRQLGYGVQLDAGDIQPFWRFTRTVDRSKGTIPVQIEVKDDDSGIPLAVDDVMDLNPTPSIRDLNLTLNLATGTWSGDTPANVGYSDLDP